jgi:hypothetical protein
VKVALAIVVFFFIGAPALSAILPHRQRIDIPVDFNNGGTDNGRDDVEKIWLDRPDGQGRRELVVTITNHSMKRAKFIITADLVSVDGSRITGSAYVSVDLVDPGQTVTARGEAKASFPDPDISRSVPKLTMAWRIEYG